MAVVGLTALDAEVEEVLTEYPGLSRCPSTSRTSFALAGRFDLDAVVPLPGGDTRVQGRYDIRIEVPAEFPQEVPRFFETGGKITRTVENHVFPDGSLCLGSPMRLAAEAQRGGTLLAFIESCLVPYLCAARMGEQGREVPELLGELDHGISGLVVDYLDLFGVETPAQLLAAMRLSVLPVEEAYRELCPRGCGRVLQLCAYQARFDEMLRIYSWKQRKRYLRSVEGYLEDILQLPRREWSVFDLLPVPEGEE